MLKRLSQAKELNDRNSSRTARKQRIPWLLAMNLKNSSWMQFNTARSNFVNHTCDPNLQLFSPITFHAHLPKIPFSARTIDAKEELTFVYQMESSEEVSSDSLA